MGVLEKWNRSVEENWDYWEYYRDLYDYSLSKGANTMLTSFLYPFFYQERLVKREFAKNMQLLGELSNEEIEEYQKLRKVPYLSNIYSYHRKPSGSLPLVLFPPALYLALGSVPFVIRANKSISWYLMVPVLTLVTTHMFGVNYYRLKITDLVDCTCWALQKRKSQVWLEQKRHPTAKIAPLPELKAQILEIVRQHKP